MIGVGSRVELTQGKTRSGTVKQIGSCEYTPCKNETCVTVLFDNRTNATENVDLSTLVEVAK